MTIKNIRRIAIMGSGGIGGFLGGQLARVGHDVTFIARGEHLTALKKQGLSIRSDSLNMMHIKPVKATDNPASVGPVDLILFSVKLYDTTTAAESCRPMIAPDTTLLTVQNGVESSDILSGILKHHRVLSGAVYISAHIQAPGIIRHSGGARKLLLAAPEPGLEPQARHLGKLFQTAGIDGQYVDNMARMLWQKFVLLCANAALGALTDQGAAALYQDPGSRALFEQTMTEVCAVAGAMNIPLPSDLIPQTMKQIAGLRPDNDLVASQCLDLRAGKPLELEWIQGTIHRLGRQYAIPTPINSTAYYALKRFAAGKLKIE